MRESLPKIRCGRCNRVIGAVTRRKRASLAQLREVQEQANAIERLKMAGELVAVERTPSFVGRLTVSGGVVTAVCKCGANATIPFPEFEAGWRAAVEKGDDYKVMFSGAP